MPCQEFMPENIAGPSRSKDLSTSTAHSLVLVYPKVPGKINLLLTNTHINYNIIISTPRVEWLPKNLPAVGYWASLANPH
jgi:hypothetical protein